ncbi:hypothetical protein FQA39_LY04613 [Lamprigera yunnana]|nr:hypothetical protein FQA39_LY04613 [Lamprigera yunnana]
MKQLKSLVDEITNEDTKKPSPDNRQGCFHMDVQGNRPTPDVMVCYKIYKEDSKQKPAKGNEEDEESSIEFHTKNEIALCKSRELLGGVLYSGCDCRKRNGLQDECKRTQCRGSPACLTKPEPTCCPSQFSNGKHLMAKMSRNEANRRKKLGGDLNKPKSKVKINKKSIAVTEILHLIKVKDNEI